MRALVLKQEQFTCQINLKTMSYALEHGSSSNLECNKEKTKEHYNV